MNNTQESVYMSVALAFALMLTAGAPLAFAQQQPPLEITVIAPTIASPGERVTILIEARFNGTLFDAVTLRPHVWLKDGPRIKQIVLPAPTRYATGHFNTTYTVPANATGTNWVHVPGSGRGFSNTGSASIRIVPPLATVDLVRGTQSALEGRFTDLRSGLDALRTRVQAVESTVGGLSNFLMAVAGLAVLIIILQVVTLTRKR